MNDAFHESFTAILKAHDALKSELSEDQFEFRCSDMSPHISIVDLNCEEEHEELDKLYGIFLFYRKSILRDVLRIFVTLQINFQKRTCS